MRILRSATLVTACAAVLVLVGCAAPAVDPDATDDTDAPSNDAPTSEALSCDEFASVIAESLPLMFVMLDTDITPPEVASAMRELSDRWSGFTPPAEIAEDWPAMTEWADTYAGAWEDVPADTDQQQAFAEIQAEYGELDDASDAAFERVSTYIEENCPPE
jgi:hypothetical protein